MEAPLITSTGDAKGKMELPASLFGLEGSKRVLHEVLMAHQANQRRGTSDTKTRAEVSGGGHKPWRQKGTGNARAGSNRSPLWRKGGIIFGPHPRSYRVEKSERSRQLALATALSVKAQKEDVAVIESLPEAKGKTAPFAEFFEKAAPAGRILVVVDKRDGLISRALRNLQRVHLMEAREVNPYALITAQKVFLTQAALKALDGRLPQGES